MWNTVGAAETVFSSRCFAVSRELSTGGGRGVRGITCVGQKKTHKGACSLTPPPTFGRAIEIERVIC